MDEVYYIRPADSETARGPFDIEKLGTLAEAGQLDRDTLYFDDELEAWAAIGSNAELTAQIYPAKKSLRLRSSGKRDRSSEQHADAEREVLSVEAMLAAAEGDTDETRHLKDEIRWQHRAASIAIPVLAAVCLISALTFLYPGWRHVEGLLNQEPGAIARVFREPLLFLGALDLFFALALFLAATEVYPLIRFRAMLGMGFFGYVYGSAMVAGDPTGQYLALAMIAYGLGVFICTVTLRFKVMAAAALCSLGGALTFAYLTTFAPLFAAGS